MKRPRHHFLFPLRSLLCFPVGKGVNIKDFSEKISRTITNPTMRSRKKQSNHLTTPWRFSFSANSFASAIAAGLIVLISNIRQIHFGIWDKYILEFETNTFWNLRQIHLAIVDKYILEFETNTFRNLRQIHIGIWDKHILQFATNAFWNWRQIQMLT